jgi:response regulator RpfG family c-di-GMP phosphodiesterase
MSEKIVAEREIWILGIKPGSGRNEQLCSYLAAGGYRCRMEQPENVDAGRPLGIILDISPSSDKGWDILLKLKSCPTTRNIPVLPVFLSEAGKVGGVFPVAGFFTLPIDEQYLLERLAVYGLTEDAETWDLQTMVISRLGEDKLSKTLETAGFEVVKAYSAKEGRALSSIHPVYMAFVSLMLPDMSAFELLEKLRLNPYNSNTPMFVLLKDEMKAGEKTAISREIAHLVSKKQLSCEEFLSYLRRRN